MNEKMNEKNKEFLIYIVTLGIVILGITLLILFTFIMAINNVSWELALLNLIFTLFLMFVLFQTLNSHSYKRDQEINGGKS